MGVQRRIVDMKGAKVRLRETQRRNREIWARMKERPLLVPGSTQGMRIDRRCMGEHEATVHPLAERATARDTLGQAAQGSAFSWWTSMTNAEKDQAIARITGKGKEFREAAKLSGAKRRQ